MNSGQPFIGSNELLNLIYRIAMPEDVPACIDLRGKTRENAVSVERLRKIGVTLESWSQGIVDGSLPGHVCLSGETIVGYCFGDRDSGEILVLALLPDWEGKGIGRRLMDIMVRDYASRGFTRLFLGCSANPQTRSYGFYRYLGWKSTGTYDALNDEILEFFPGR